MSFIRIDYAGFGTSCDVVKDGGLEFVSVADTTATEVSWPELFWTEFLTTWSYDGGWSVEESW